jgi:hypothetical protein
MININRPKDKILKGNVNIIIIGRKNELKNPRIKLATRADSIPLTSIPVTIYDVKMIAIELINHLNNNPIRNFAPL